jgi:hypothetical protein
MAKKKAAVKKVGTRKLKAALDQKATLEYGAQQETIYATNPTVDLLDDSRAYVTVGYCTIANDVLSISVASTTHKIDTFGFVVEDIAKSTPQKSLDFSLSVDPFDNKKGSLTSKNYSGTGTKIRITILTKKLPKPPKLPNTKKPKKTKVKVDSKATKK